MASDRSSENRNSCKKIPQKNIFIPLTGFPIFCFQESGSDIPFSDDELPSDVDTNDPFFQSEMPKKKKSKKKEDIAKSKANEDEERENNVKKLLI